MSQNYENLFNENEKLINEIKIIKQKFEIINEMKNILEIICDSCECNNSLKLSTNQRYKQLVNKFEQLVNYNNSNDSQLLENDNSNNEKSLWKNKICPQLGTDENEIIIVENHENIYTNEELLSETIECDLIFDNKNHSNYVNFKSNEKTKSESNSSQSVKKYKNKSQLRSSDRRLRKSCEQQINDISRDDKLNKEIDSDSKRAKNSIKEISCCWPGCDSRFRNRFDFEDHIWRHSGEKSFSCQWPECGKSYANKRGLIRHLGIHLEKTKYKCDWPGCEYRSLYAEGVRVHKRKHTNERPHRCSWPHCEWTFRQAHHLKTHMLRHTKEKPWTCDLSSCDKRFQTKQAMKLHYDRAHKRIV